MNLLLSDLFLDYKSHWIIIGRQGHSGSIQPLLKTNSEAAERCSSEPPMCYGDLMRGGQMEMRAENCEPFQPRPLRPPVVFKPCTRTIGLPASPRQDLSRVQSLRPLGHATGVRLHGHATSTASMLRLLVVMPPASMLRLFVVMPPASMLRLLVVMPPA